MVKSGNRKGGKVETLENRGGRLWALGGKVQGANIPPSSLRADFRLHLSCVGRDGGQAKAQRRLNPTESKLIQANPSFESGERLALLHSQLMPG
jgi:hypothetical protein